MVTRMGARSQLRKDFPRGWWHSGTWWWRGLVDLVLRLMMTFAPLLLLGRVIHIVHNSRRPKELARDDARLDAWAGGVLTGGLVLVVVSLVGIPGDPIVSPMLLSAIVIVCLLNMSAAMTVVLVVFRSRREQRVEWAMRDFVDDNAPVSGHAPQTPAEYEAEKLRESL